MQFVALPRFRRIATVYQTDQPALHGREIPWGRDTLIYQSIHLIVIFIFF
jgi:hypothetical protein